MHKRSLAKTLTWRVIATLITASIVYILTGKFELAATIGLLDAAVKTVAYYYHERAWEKDVFKRIRE